MAGSGRLDWEDRLEEQLSGIAVTVTNVENMVRNVLFGDPSRPHEPGLFTRVDRIERDNQRRDRIVGWLLAPLWAGVVALVLKAIFEGR